MFPLVRKHNILKKYLCQDSHIVLSFLSYKPCLSLKVSAGPNEAEHFDMFARYLKIVMPRF